LSIIAIDVKKVAIKILKVAFIYIDIITKCAILEDKTYKTSKNIWYGIYCFSKITIKYFKKIYK
jgi:hypothetical protein